MNSSELQAQLEQHHRENYCWALGCCSGNAADAEGVLQTVYLKILEGKAVFHGAAKFKTWLFSVIRKTAAEEHRRKILHRIWLVRYQESADRRPPGEPLDEALYRSEIQSLFRQALAALPRRQQQVLRLAFYHELSLSEAAEVLGISVGAARTHYERGKKQIRERMKGVISNGSAARRKKDKGTVSTAETGG